MSLETYLKRTVKTNDLPYVKQAIKEWLLPKTQTPFNGHKNMFCRECRGKRKAIKELLEELQK